MSDEPPPELVERVAEAIKGAMYSWVPMEGDYLEMARAAIKAMQDE